MSGSNYEERQRNRPLSNSLTVRGTHLGDQTKLSMASSILVCWRSTASSCVPATEAPRQIYMVASTLNCGGWHCYFPEHRERLRLLFQHIWKEEVWTLL